MQTNSYLNGHQHVLGACSHTHTYTHLHTKNTIYCLGQSHTLLGKFSLLFLFSNELAQINNDFSPQQTEIERYMCVKQQIKKHNLLCLDRQQQQVLYTLYIII